MSINPLISFPIRKIYCIVQIFVIFIVILNCRWDLALKRSWKGIDKKELELELELLFFIPKELELNLKELALELNWKKGIDPSPAHGILDKPLTVLFNHVLITRSYPSTWCDALINPLLKQESPTLPDNYRKMTITPAIGTIFDGILNNRLQFAKECLSLGAPLQNGFKPNANANDGDFFYWTESLTNTKPMATPCIHVVLISSPHLTW